MLTGKNLGYRVLTSRLLLWQLKTLSNKLSVPIAYNKDNKCLNVSNIMAIMNCSQVTNYKESNSVFIT